MMISRRAFLGGATAFGAFGGSRFFCARADEFLSGVPELTFGVVSDIHFATERKGLIPYYNADVFVQALEYFRGQGVDAVVCCGDMADRGLIDELRAVGAAWDRVFPDGKAPDGRPVEKVFVCGNHDWEGQTYGQLARSVYPDDAAFAAHVLRNRYDVYWKECFHEDYRPIYRKTVKGYDFIGQHWDGRGLKGNVAHTMPRIRDFLQAQKATLDPSKPFFYVQHPHPKGTCFAALNTATDTGLATRALSKFPNAVALSGHSHIPFTDDHAIWQGSFTSIAAGSLRWSSRPRAVLDESGRILVPGGYENGVGLRAGAAEQPFKLMESYNGYNCHLGMVFRVYKDRIVVSRRDIKNGLALGPDWVMPLPAAEPKPFSFVERAKHSVAPEFAAGAVARVVQTKAKTRGGKLRDGTKVPVEEKDVYKVSFPPANAVRGGRVFDYEVVATCGEVRKSKYVLAAGYNQSAEHPKAREETACVFAVADFPSEEIEFSIVPRESYGRRGRPLLVRMRLSGGKKS